MSKRNVIIWVVAFWMAAVLGFVWYMEYVKSKWEIVIVKVIPVDPRDFFRWDYVTLSFPFSRPSGENVDKTNIYAAYSKWVDNRLIEVTWYVNKMPLGWRAIKWSYPNDNWSRLEFWIEQFYVSEERWHDLEEKIRSKNVEAEIAIDIFWRGIIKNILVDGVIWNK
jgi:uncharacterized membrane-anchored protein